VRYIHSNLDSKLTWEELASAVGMDVFDFGRGFKMSTGTTPHQYVIRCRLRRAVKLLQYGEMSITDIALEVGCSCQSHLTTLFGRYIGTTPGALRTGVKQSRELLNSALRPLSLHESKRHSATAHDSTRL
jgi:AraC family transcriptional regulator